MKFKEFIKENNTYTILSDPKKLNGSSLRTSILTTYAQLEKLFGEPRKTTGDNKTHVVWDLVDNDKNYLSIYDWKESFDPSEKQDKKIEWNIGGFKGIAALNLKEYIENNI